MKTPRPLRRRAPHRLVYGLNEQALRSFLHRLCCTRLGLPAGTAAYRRILRDHPDTWQLWLDTLRSQLSHDQVLEQLLASHCQQTFERLLAPLLIPGASEPPPTPPQRP